MKFNSTTPIASSATELIPICRVAAPANVSISTPGTVIDGVTLIVGDRVLLLNQSNSTQNGFYKYSSAVTPMTRSADVLVRAGMITLVSEGASNGDKVFQLITDGAIVLGTTSLTFTSIIPAVPDFIMQGLGIL